MQPFLSRPISLQSPVQVWLVLLFVVMLVSFLGGTVLQMPALFALPAIVLAGYLVLVDFRKVFYLLLATLPLSTELLLPGGIGMDFPSELITILLMGVYLVYLLRYAPAMDGSFFKHPLSLLLLLHLGWIGITALHAGNVLIAVKFFLAKTWYIVTFYFLTGLLIQTHQHLQSLFRWVFYPLLFTICIILIRHGMDGFTFAGVNRVLNPFYRNHVSYASIIVVFFPFLWYSTTWVNRYSRLWWFRAGSIILVLIATYLTYTRAAYVCILAMPFIWLLLKWRLMKPALLVACITTVLGVFYLVENNRYLDYAPDFDKTITHKKFDNLIDATAKGEDISTMERVYRWIAGVQMAAERPWTGFGPGNFYSWYQQYTVTSFRTYVSDNPEKSSTHCYYLMVAADQGIPGLIVFLAICFSTLLLAEKLYHQIKDPKQRQIVIICIISYVTILLLLIINDMIEADKVGPFFFINMAILVNQDISLQKTILSDSSLSLEK